MRASSSGWVDRRSDQPATGSAIGPTAAAVRAFVEALERPQDHAPTGGRRLADGRTFTAALLPALSGARSIRHAWTRGITQLAEEAGTPLADRAALIVEGLCLLGEVHHDAAAHVLLPRLEHIARASAAAANDAEAAATTGWSRILDALDGVVRPSTVALLRTELLAPMGPSLRNDLVHGNTAGPSLEDASLIAYALLLLLRDAAEGR
jgi:hypothetical protein